MSDQSKSRLILVSLRLPFVVTRKDDGTIGRTESRDEMYQTMSHVVLQSKGSKWIGNPGTSYQKVALSIYFLIALILRNLFRHFDIDYR